MSRLTTAATLVLMLLTACGRTPEPGRVEVVVPEPRTEAQVIARVVETVAAEWPASPATR